MPRPVADLVYAMLAKDPEDRPESARHVADRAEVIREARTACGYSGPITSDLPVVPNFPPATSTDLYQNDAGTDAVVSRLGNRRLAFAGSGAAAIGVVAIIAVVLISSNGNASPSTRDQQRCPPSRTAAEPRRRPRRPRRCRQATVGSAGHRH